MKALLIAASVAAFLALAASTALADVVVCPLEEAMRRLEEYNITFKGELATQQMPLLNEMASINAKAKNQSLPLGAQLDRSDIERFQQLRTEMIREQINGLIFSNYLRDSRVIAQSAKVAAELRYGKTFDQSDPEFFYYSVVMLLALQHPQDKSNITTPRNGECTVESGLHFDEQITLKEIDNLYLDWKPASERLNVLARRYGLDTKSEGWVDKIPSIEERAAARADMGVVKRGVQELEYLNNLENLKALARVSVLEYSSDKEDLNAARDQAGLGRIGTMWPDKIKKYDDRTQVLAGILEIIARKLPSDAAIEARGVTKTLGPGVTR